MSAVINILKRLPRLLGQLFLGVLCWIFIRPIAWMMPRRADCLTIIGRNGGKFTENTKYFFLEANEILPSNVACIFLTEHEIVANMLESAEYKVVRYPSWRGIWTLFRTGIVVVDSQQWPYKLRGHLLAGAKIVQLWHGVGFKRIGNDFRRNQAAAFRLLSSRPFARLVQLTTALRGYDTWRYDVVNTTSRFYRDNVFKPAFTSQHYLLAGYPRNSFGAGLPPTAKELVWGTVDQWIREKLAQWQADKKRIVLVTPTYRDTRSTPIGLDEDVVSYVDNWCDEYNVEMIFKFHPVERGVQQVRGKHLHLCKHDSDIYPLMPFSAALVTDYSSIYMDYLLLDKPVLFLTPDLEKYIQLDRQIQFDYNEMTPGPKARSWDELLEELVESWQVDRYETARVRLKEKAFDGLPQNQATQKVIDFIYAQQWLH